MEDSGFKDYFSGHAVDYAKYRPVYPGRFFEYLAGTVEQHQCAWDCATGNGQAALGLAKFFDQVVATDASQQQIAHARSHPKVTYIVAPAERVPLVTGSIDLVFVAQALHWFAFEEFYAEVGRVLRPRGIIAAACYGWTRIAPEVDEIVRRYESEIVGSYWPPERMFVDEQYRTLPFPFPELAAPNVEMEKEWTLDEFTGYLETWSASQRYRAALGVNPVDSIRNALERAWGGRPAKRIVHWPLFSRIGRIPG